jgi:sulfotransferase family protein
MEARATSRTSSDYQQSSPPPEPAARQTAPDSGERSSLSGQGSYLNVPRVIFGTSGSGTRSLAEITFRAGFFMGTRLTQARDSEDLIQFFEKWINRYVAHTRWLKAALDGQMIHVDPPSSEMEEDFSRAIDGHRAALPHKSARWGWKGPRGMYVLPFLHRRYPEMRAVHLIRDGRDMAYSKNQHELRHSEAALDGDFRSLPEPVHSIMIWSRLNLATARYGETQMPERYLRVKFEDLCSDPTVTVGRILEFFGADIADEEVRKMAEAVISPPLTSHRWRARSARELKPVLDEGAAALQHFGYL